MNVHKMRLNVVYHNLRLCIDIDDEHYEIETDEYCSNFEWHIFLESKRKVILLKRYGKYPGNYIQQISILRGFYAKLKMFHLATYHGNLRAIRRALFPMGNDIQVNTSDDGIEILYLDAVVFKLDLPPHSYPNLCISSVYTNEEYSELLYRENEFDKCEEKKLRGLSMCKRLPKYRLLPDYPYIPEPGRHYVVPRLCCDNFMTIANNAGEIWAISYEHERKILGNTMNLISRKLVDLPYIESSANLLRQCYKLPFIRKIVCEMVPEDIRDEVYRRCIVFSQEIRDYPFAQLLLASFVELLELI